MKTHISSPYASRSAARFPSAPTRPAPRRTVARETRTDAARTASTTTPTAPSTVTMSTAPGPTSALAGRAETIAALAETCPAAPFLRARAACAAVMHSAAMRPGTSTVASWRRPSAPTSANAELLRRRRRRQTSHRLRGGASFQRRYRPRIPHRLQAKVPLAASTVTSAVAAFPPARTVCAVSMISAAMRHGT